MVIPPSTARRLVVRAQRLQGTLPSISEASLLAVVRGLGYLQLDPVQVIAPSHRLVVWSRLGAYPPQMLDALLWRQRLVMEYWAHAACIVATEDYWLHAYMRRGYPSPRTAWGRRMTAWVEANEKLRRKVLSEIRRRGPLAARDITDSTAVSWQSPGWSSGRNVDRMLFYLWVRGHLAVAGRSGGRRRWDLRERWLPSPGNRPYLSERRVAEALFERALIALGLARLRDVPSYLPIQPPEALRPVLDGMLRNGRILPVQIASTVAHWPGEWYIHRDRLADLESCSADDWTGRTTLLSPFDNLINDRPRTKLVFDFDFRLEIYVPASARLYGAYTLAILHEDRLIGRVDAALNRGQRCLVVRALHAEPGAATPQTGAAVGGVLKELASFLGATRIDLGSRRPAAWRHLPGL